jgi:hypothetical protein
MESVGHGQRKRLDAVERIERGTLTVGEAAVVLGLSTRPGAAPAPHGGERRGPGSGAWEYSARAAARSGDAHWFKDRCAEAINDLAREMLGSVG